MNRDVFKIYGKTACILDETHFFQTETSHTQGTQSVFKKKKRYSGTKNIYFLYLNQVSHFISLQFTGLSFHNKIDRWLPLRIFKKLNF